MLLQGLTADVTADADQPDLDAEAIHLMQSDADRVARAIELLGHGLEHVLDREIELRRRVLELFADEIVHRKVLGRETDHGVHDADIGRHGHGVQASYKAFWNR